MPVEARGNKIYEKKTGKEVGRSKSPEMAKRAARVRNAVHFSDWRPAKGPKRKTQSGGSGY